MRSSVLPCFVVSCSVLKKNEPCAPTTRHCNTPQHTATRYITPQYTQATHLTPSEKSYTLPALSLLRHCDTTTHCTTLDCMASSLNKPSFGKSSFHKKTVVISLSCAWVMSRMNELCHIWMSHSTYEYNPISQVMAHTWISHGTQLTESWHTRQRISLGFNKSV